MSDLPRPTLPSCRRCGTAVGADQRFCPACGEAQVATAPPPPATATSPAPVVALTPKSAGLAVFLTFLWLGAGHLYVDRIASGIALLVVDLVLWLLMFSFFGIIIAFPVWLVLFVVASVRVAFHANAFNSRLIAR